MQLNSNLYPLKSPFELFRQLWSPPPTIQKQTSPLPVVIGQVEDLKLFTFQSQPKAQPNLDFVSTIAKPSVQPKVDIVSPPTIKSTGLSSDNLNLPPRSSKALTGSQFFEKVQTMDRMKREEAIKQEILNGNIPDHLRQLQTIEFTAISKDKQKHTVSIQVAPEYLAIGSNSDYVLVPMDPITAQAIADQTGTYLPTRKIVDEIYKHADIKLAPSPQKPGPQMMSTPYYAKHNQTIVEQRIKAKATASDIIAGHKKDVVITNRLNQKPKSVAIYGWHQPNGKAIQPLSTIHENTYADYSHGARLVGGKVTVDGVNKSMTEVLNDPNLSFVLSDEGIIKNFRATR